MTTSLIFGKYEIQHRIAIGGMGEVFYAIQRGVSGFERPVILKSLLPDLAQQKDLVDQFLDEARVAATLNHPNVVSIFEVGLWNGTFYIAMEYIRGRNLSQLIRRSIENQLRIPPQVAARIIRDAALGLDHAHHAVDNNGQPLRIVHRDISPQNIMLREDGVTKVVDFGIASAANRSTRTATGMIKGKLAYMPPEQVHSLPMTPLVDQYALGVVLWEMLTSRRLFRAENDVELIKLVLASNIERPERLAADIPPALADVVMKMVSAVPEDRYASLGEVAEVLDGQLAGQTPALSPAALMRRLGTDDLKVQISKTQSPSDNFVISLNQSGAPPESVDVEVVTRGSSPGQDSTGVLTTPSAPALAAPPPPPRSRVPIIAAVAVLVLSVAGVGAAKFAGPKEKADPPVVASVVAPKPSVPDAVVTPPPAAAIEEASLTLVTTPPGAQLRVDGRQLGVSPQTLKLAPGSTHYVAAELKGFERSETELTLAAGEARTVTVELKGLKPRPTLAVVPGPPPKPPVTAQGPGFLTINTEPWTKVSVDDEPIGSTPISKKRLAAGTHRLVLTNEGANLNVTRSVLIVPGETLKLQLKLP